jgi:zona occludens toxin (predicted ATPase)
MNLNITACAAIVDATPIRHLDTKSMEMKRDFLQFKFNAFKVVEEYQRLFPRWSIADTYRFLNPASLLYGQYFRRASGPLDAQCLARRSQKPPVEVQWEFVT